MAALGPAFERQNLSQKGQHKFSASSHTVEEIGPKIIRRACDRTQKLMQQFCASAAIPTTTLLAQSRLLRNLRAGHRVIRGDHRIIPRQIPFRTILIGRHLVHTQVTLERLERLELRLDTVRRRGREGRGKRSPLETAQRRRLRYFGPWRVPWIAL